MTDHNQPTSDWEHSHALAEGGELVDTGEDTPLTVETVHDDGSVTVQVWADERHGEDYVTETWDEEQVRVGLRDGIIETTDGQSHELAAF